MLTWGPPKMWNYKQVQSTNSWYYIIINLLLKVQAGNKV